MQTLLKGILLHLGKKVIEVQGMVTGDAERFEFSDSTLKNAAEEKVITYITHDGSGKLVAFLFVPKSSQLHLIVFPLVPLSKGMRNK